MTGLSHILSVPEKQIVIVSVTAGSVIVELAFVRIDGATSSPTEVVSRLKTAAKSGQLDKFGLTSLSVGQENVFDTNIAVSEGTIVGASVGSVIGAIVLGALIWKLRQTRRLQVSSTVSSFVVASCLCLTDFLESRPPRNHIFSDRDEQSCTQV